MKARLLPLGAASAALCLLTTAGCLVGSSEKTRYRGQYVDDSLLDQVKPGQTEAKVRSLIGDPTTKSTDGDTTVWRYHYHKAVTKTGAVFLLFARTTETETEGSVVVRFEDAKVIDVVRQ